MATARSSLRLVLRVALLAVAALSYGCGWFGEDQPSSSEDLTAIEAFNSRYLAAINSRDVDTLTELTTESQIVFLPDRAPIAGKAAIVDAYRAVFERFVVAAMWSPGETALGGDWAYQRGRFRHTNTPESQGVAQTSAGHYLRIFARQPDGSWRITIDMYHSDAPPPPDP